MSCPITGHTCHARLPVTTSKGDTIISEHESKASEKVQIKGTSAIKTDVSCGAPKPKAVDAHVLTSPKGSSFISSHAMPPRSGIAGLNDEFSRAEAQNWLVNAATFDGPAFQPKTIHISNRPGYNRDSQKVFTQMNFSSIRNSSAQCVRQGRVQKLRQVNMTMENPPNKGNRRNIRCQK